MDAVSNTSTPTSILRQRTHAKQSQSKEGKGMIARTTPADAYLGSPISRSGVHFAAPDNLPELLTRLSEEKNEATNRKVKSKDKYGLFFFFLELLFEG